MSSTPEFCGLREAAAQLGRSEQEVLSLVAAAGVRLLRHDGRLVFPAEDLPRLTAAAGSRPAPAAPARAAPPPGASDSSSDSGWFQPQGGGGSARSTSDSQSVFPASEVVGSGEIASGSGLFNLSDLGEGGGGHAKVRPVELDGTRQLFPDDTLIQVSNGVERRYHGLTRAPGPMIRAEADWEAESGCRLGGVAYDLEEKLFKLWYSARGRGGPAVGYAVSRDGVRWTRPAVKGSGAEGPAGNRLPAALPPGETAGQLAGMIRGTPRGPMDVLYKMAFQHADQERGGRGIQTAVSTDGLKWQSSGRAVLGQFRESGCLMRDDRGDCWIIWGCVSLSNKRVVLRAESDDYALWTAAEPISWQGKTGSAETDLQSLTVFATSGIYFGLRHMRPGSGPGDKNVTTAFSRDGWTWSVMSDEPLLSAGGPGDWDGGWVNIPGPPLRVGKELWFYYSGRPATAEVAAATTAQASKTAASINPSALPAGIGLARMRRDGFVSIGAGEAGGSFTTRPAVLAGPILHLNAAAPKGEIRIRLTDLQGQVLEGMEAVPVTGDDVDLKVVWPAGRSLANYMGRPIRLQFELRNARIYSLWMQ